jgi:predicted GNAT superfamily acetyltransferase
MIVRALSGHAEFAEAVRLQKEIWGFPDLELLPVRFFVVASRIGGQTLGAFDGDRMAGFLLAIPGIKKDTGMPYLHSHMLGVLNDYRNAGVGRALKSAQREDALDRGIRLIEWSFDPFEAKNAYFNMEVLGAIVRTYVPNMYGITASPLHGDLPTDRCIAEWRIIDQRPADRPHDKSQVAFRVSLPPQKTRESQESLARELQRHFADGLAVTGFERSETSGTYLLSPWPSK